MLQSKQNTPLHYFACSLKSCRRKETQYGTIGSKNSIGLVAWSMKPTRKILTEQFDRLQSTTSLMNQGFRGSQPSQAMSHLTSGNNSAPFTVIPPSNDNVGG